MWTVFDPDHKKERYETVFPQDKMAFALGEQMRMALGRNENDPE